MVDFLFRYPAMLFFMLCLVVNSSGQEKQFRKYDMNSGLSNNSVLTLLQDGEGFVWMGTRDGLNRFNGIDFQVFKHHFADTSSLSNNQVNCLYESSDSSIWIGTANGLNRYKKSTGRFERFLIPSGSGAASGNYIRSIAESNDRLIWLGTTTGLCCYHPVTSVFENYLINPDKSHLSNIIVCIFTGEAGRIFLGTRKGLWCFEKGQFRRIFIDKMTETQTDRFEIRDIKKDAVGTYWIATEGFGLYSLKLEGRESASARRFSTRNSGIASDFVRKVYISPGGTIWAGTTEGLSLFTVPGPKFMNITYSPENTEGIADNSIRDIIRDNTGGYWIGTYAGGVKYYHPQNNLFPHYKRGTGKGNSLSDNAVSGFLEDGKGNIWIATERGGLNYWDPVTGKFSQFIHSGLHTLADNNVKALTYDKKGNLWIGTYNGLSVLNPATRRFRNFFRNTGNGNSLNHNQVHALHMDKNGLLWIGTNGGGVQTLDPERFVFTAYPKPGRENINAITEDSGGMLWIASQNGLFCMDRKTCKDVDLSGLMKELKNPVIYVQSLLADSSGNVWAGTQGYGLYLIRNNKIHWFSMLDGLPDNTVNALLEERRGTYWMTTNQGISRFVLTENSSGEPLLTTKHYSTSQGVQGKQFYPRSALKTRSGMFFFGGINGFNAFFPGAINDTVFYPEVQITRINIRDRNSGEQETGSPLNKPVSGTGEITLKYNQRDISLGFIGINYMNPEGTYYRYRMKGLNENWIDLGNKRELNFAYLPVGNYELQMKASTHPDKWGDGFRSLSIQVLPPWYRSVYALVFYVAFAGILLFIFFRYSQKWAKLKNELAMEHFQREKEEELHQMKLKFFTDVSHEIRTPLTLITAPLEQITNQSDLSYRLRNQLLSIQRNSQRLIHLINKVLDLRKLETGHGKLEVSEENLTEFLKETCLAFQESARIKNISLDFSSPVENYSAWYDREKLEIILYNLLSNALKFTGIEGKIRVRLNLIRTELPDGMKVQGEVAEITVEDNGEGIPAGKLETIFDQFSQAGAYSSNMVTGTGVGLDLTKRLVELHKGVIKVESRVSIPPEPGFTKFTVLIPVNREAYHDEEINHEVPVHAESSGFVLKSDPAETSGEAAVGNDSVLSGGSSKSAKKRKLLIIEDNHELRKFLCGFFENQFVVDEAEDGLSGWIIAAKVIPDLVISDVMMPGMNGIELCRKMKTDIRTSHIPVILLTARTAITYRYEGIETGADDYITKPFTTEYLHIRVNNLIRQRELMRNHFVNEMICDPEKITVTSTDEKLLKKAVDYITQNLSAKSVSVEKLSSEIGLSRVHFYRKIKAFTNLSAVEFIRSIKLKNAALLLEQ